MRKLFAEMAGTFCLVFAGTGAIVVNDLSGGAVTHVGVALTFGLVVLAMIYALGDISGAHLNPAVTIGFFAAGRFPGRMVLPYAASQLGGALGASLVLRGIFPAHAGLGGTVPSGPVAQSLVMEFILTTILMFVILSVSSGSRERGITAGLVVGGVITLGALFGGPVSGASMNPARSFAPAVVSGDVSALWIYLAAPLAGALAGVGVCRAIRGGGCCRNESVPETSATSP